MNRWRIYQGLLKLMGFIVMIPLVAWYVGFRETFGLWREYRGLKEKLEYLNVASKNDGKGVVSEVWSSGHSLGNGVLLERLSPVVKDNGVAIVKYTPFLTREEGDMQLFTGELVLSGGFIALLRVMLEVENNEKMGKIISTTFQVFRERGGKEKKLKMTLVIQQLIRKIETVK